MPNKGGRDQRVPMERLVRIAAALKVAGADGMSATRLVRASGFEGDNAMDQLERDLRFLRAQGWQIDQVSEPGEPGRFRMVTVDNRFRVRLTAGQQRALQRAVLLADRADLVERLGLPAAEAPAEVLPTLDQRGPGPTLSRVLEAVRFACLLRFRYAGKDRVVHPESVRNQNDTWYLRGVEDGDDLLKTFVVARMSQVEHDAPGTGRAVRTDETLTLHPMRWQVDPPVQVRLRTSAAYLPDVERWLGAPASTEPAAEGDGEVLHLVYDVTNRASFRARLHELGPRVVLLSPDEVRAELLAELEAMAR